jgi:hypothetical protein
MAATQKEPQKILEPDLAQAKKVMLAQTIMTPGWKVVVEIANSACRSAMQDTIKLDPESEDYERVVIERQRRARNITEFSDLLMRSIHEHADSIRNAERKEEAEAVTRVADMFGIHPAKPEEKGKPTDAITRTFGIHPARPVKSESPVKGKK